MPPRAGKQKKMDLGGLGNYFVVGFNESPRYLQGVFRFDEFRSQFELTDLEERCIINTYWVNPFLAIRLCMLLHGLDDSLTIVLN